MLDHHISFGMKLLTKKVKTIVTCHLNNVRRALLEGEYRLAFLEFLKSQDGCRGLYALYDNKGRLHYVGKASDLPTRLNQHLVDRHADSWDYMSLFFLNNSVNISELEGLLVATAKPEGNKQKPHIGKDLRRGLEKFLKTDSTNQISQAIYPEKRKNQSDKLFGRITPKKLKTVSQGKLAKALGISQGRVSQLVKKDNNSYSLLRQYIRESGRRDRILLALDKK
jgi:hypothetical protein